MKGNTFFFDKKIGSDKKNKSKKIMQKKNEKEHLTKILTKKSIQKLKFGGPNPLLCKFLRGYSAGPFTLDKTKRFYALQLSGLTHIGKIKKLRS